MIFAAKSVTFSLTCLNVFVSNQTVSMQYENLCRFLFLRIPFGSSDLVKQGIVCCGQHRFFLCLGKTPRAFTKRVFFFYQT